MNTAKNINEGEKNLNQFLGLFAILFVILIGYFITWKIITGKIKKIIISKLNNITYESIVVGGFPFSKKIKITNINLDNSIIDGVSVNIDNVTISSFLFSSLMNIELGDIKIYMENEVNNLAYKLIYNEKPKINIAWYLSNGWLREFSYTDNGYKIAFIENDNIAYKIDKSSIILNSTKNRENIDYSFISNISNVENIENTKQSKYSILSDISYSYTQENGVFNKSIIKINNISTTNELKTGLIITGDIYKDREDLYSYGNVKFTFLKYKEVFKNLKDELNKLLNDNMVKFDKNMLTKKNDFTKITNILFEEMETILKKNRETNNDGILEITREKNTRDYLINGDSFIQVISRISEKLSKFIK